MRTLRIFRVSLATLGALCAVGCPPTDDGGGGGGGEDAVWWSTCGDPVCSGYAGPFDGVAVCADEVEGATCGEDGAECDLESDCNTRLVCAVDDPKADGCPISLRASKKHIRYLDRGGLKAAADEALAVRLATWRYREEPDAARPHLGFVIDDRPLSPAVSSDGGRVDLYGYTSLALAAVQVQQSEIEALRAEIEALRAECRPRSED